MMRLLIMSRTLSGYKASRRLYRLLDKPNTSTILIGIAVILTAFAVWRVL